MSQSFSEKLTGLRAAGLELDLPFLIALASTHQFTPEEDQTIRRNLIISELMAQNPHLRRHRAEALVKEAQNGRGSQDSAISRTRKEA